MSPRPSRLCTVIDCGRAHHAQGLCRVHYGEKVRKGTRKERSASWPSHVPQNRTAGSPASTQEPGGGGGHHTSSAKSVGTYYAAASVAPPSFFDIPLWMQAGMVALFLCALVILLCVAMYALEVMPRLHSFLCRVLGDEEGEGA